MIIAIESSLPTFKTVEFRRGLNVVVADTAPTASEKQTRNSAGKTSLIEIIHFLLGSQCDRRSLFRADALIEHNFIGTFVIGGQKMRVMRSGADPNRIYVLEGTHGSGLPVKTHREAGRGFVSLNDWRAFLGYDFFGLPLDVEGSSFGKPFSPSFRSMFSYFARRRAAGGFMSPERNSEMQPRWNWQVNLSYLLQLDWEIPSAFHRVRERERTLGELKKAARGGALGGVIGTVAELRPQVTVAEKAAQLRRQQLARFEVHESYREHAGRAARAKTEMQILSREAVQLQETLDNLEQALEGESPPTRSDLGRLYAAAGVELPGVALRRLEDVSLFYESVVQNRQAHLKQEIAEARVRLAEVERRLPVLDAERQRILQMLEGRGALEDFLSLQRDLADLEAEASALRERFAAAELLEGESTALDLDRTNLKLRLQADHQQRKAALDKAIILIADAIGELYDDRAGRFEVEATANGPEFSISIEGDRGGGISNMEIFCFDLALFQIGAGPFGGPSFLVHDSHLFDGVDERQVARALMLGQRAADARQKQYIVTMNSDIFDRLPLPDEVDRNTVVLPTRLSDESESGGLFGFRFD